MRNAGRALSRVLSRPLRLAALALLLGAMPAAAGAPVPPVSDADYRDDGSADPARVELGRLLFFDKILSGNLNISCATCHHPLAGTGDGLALPVGEGGRGLGVTRDTGHGDAAIGERVPRNAPPLFNLGAREFVRLFADGRVEEDPFEPAGFRTPAGDQLPDGLDSVLAAQAMFPVASGSEMAGQAGENEQADTAAQDRLAGPGGVWDLIARKLQAVPGYVALFQGAFPGQVVEPDDIDFVLAANAIAAYEASAWRSDNSPFDRYLRGELRALSREARLGMGLFYGEARCGTCHTGPFQTDHFFHAIAIPQIGPGKGDTQAGYTDGLDDFGRERVSGEPRDRFSFRTPPLRNVALTAPYGHSGAYDSLEAIVRHYIDPVAALHGYDTAQAVLPPRPDLDERDFALHRDPLRRAAIAAANEAIAVPLGERDVQNLLAFLHALTDPAAQDLRDAVPDAVPSGLPIRD